MGETGAYQPRTRRTPSESFSQDEHMSWQASDAVWRTFDRKENAREFLMMLSMAHHYNEKLGRSFPSLETSTAEVRCSRRWAIKLRSNLVAKGDILVIEKGGGRGHPTVYALHPKYVEKMNSTTSPFNTEKVNSCDRKDELSYARKGEQPARRSAHESNKTKKKACVGFGVAASAAAIRS